jgi:hypothetical protein
MKQGFETLSREEMTLLQILADKKALEPKQPSPRVKTP